MWGGGRDVCVRRDADAHRGGPLVLTTLALALILTGATARVGAQGPVPERNVNVLGGPTFLSYDPNDGSVEIAGDPWRNQQVEPTVTSPAAIPRARARGVIVCSAADFRLVDLPGGADGVHHDSWNMIAQSPDGGTTWSSTLHPGHPLDPAPNALSKYDFGADPIVRAGAAGLFYHAGLVADRPTGVPNPEGTHDLRLHLDPPERPGGRPHPGQDRPELPPRWSPGTRGSSETGPTSRWVSRTGRPAPSRSTSPWYDEEGNKSVETVTQTVPATPAYLAVTTFLGQDLNTRSKMHFLKTDDCGQELDEGDQGQRGLRDQPGPPDRQVRRVKPKIFFSGAWVRGPTSPTDAIMVARSEDEGRTFIKAPGAGRVCPFDQPTSATPFRTKTVAVGGRGRTRTAPTSCGPTGRMPREAVPRVSMTSRG